MKRAKERKSYGSAAFFATVILLLSALCVVLFRDSPDRLLSLGERAAFLSAIAAMPDSGLDLLQTRFQDELAMLESQDDTLEAPSNPETSGSFRAPQDVAPLQDKSAENSVKIPKTPTDIPEEYRRTLLEENFSVSDETAYIRWGNGFLKNSTSLEQDEVAEIMDGDYSLWFQDAEEPQVLIVHTHTTESYEPFDSDFYDNRNTWRSTDYTQNMAAVGDAITEELTAAGIGVLHDTTLHDHPSYNGSYERSAETIKAYLEEYPSIKVVLDIHRDAIERDNQVIVKPTAVIDGKKAAQVMIIAGCDDGTMDMPNWRENLKFAIRLQNQMESAYHGLTRPILFSYRKYNQDLTTGSLLLEVGSNANTLEEAVYSGQLVGRSLAALILEYTD